MRILMVVLGLAALALIATYARYESFHPCDWLQQDTVRTSALPALAAQAQIRAAFLLRGIAEPDAGDCLKAWWDLRSEGDPTAAR